jgi:hypothetical protein
MFVRVERLYPRGLALETQPAPSSADLYSLMFLKRTFVTYDVTVKTQLLTIETRRIGKLSFTTVNHIRADKIQPQATQEHHNDVWIDVDDLQKVL